MKNSIQASMSNQTNELKNMMASFFQMNTASTLSLGPLPSNTIANPKGKLKAITTRSGIVLDGPSVYMPPPFINPVEDERVEETLTDQDLAEYTMKVPPPLVQKPKPPSQRNFVVQFTFPSDFVIVDYESDPINPLILGRPFLWTARALIDVHREEMILPSINMINIFDDSCEDFLEDWFATNHQSSNPTFSSHLNLTSPEVKDDIFDPEGDMVLIKKLINLDSTKDLLPPHNEIDSIFEDLIDKDNLANLNDNLVDTIPEMFIDEHAL
nr:hypothetical protein [Tanacetum cinerariifolium]